MAGFRRAQDSFEFNHLVQWFKIGKALHILSTCSFISILYRLMPELLSTTKMLLF